MKDKSNSLLSTMVGKEVKAYKAGPESWHGRLVAVKPDFIVVTNEKDGVIFVKNEHIKSVVEDPRMRMIEGMELPVDEDVVDADSFEEVLGELVDQTVKINRGGPNSTTGELLAVTAEYVVLDSEHEGVSYYNISHIKSVTVKPDQGNEGEEMEDEKGTEANERADGEAIYFLDVDDLHHLYKEMKFDHVIINAGPEKVEGILVDTKHNQLTLVARDEIVRVNKLHVKSIRQKSNTNQTNSENNNQQNSILSNKKKIQDRRKKR